MINRRTLLFGTAGLALGSLLTSCGSATANALRVMLLEGSVPPEVLKKFRQQAEEPVNFQMTSQLETVFQQLQRWQLPPETPAFSLRRFLPWAQTEAGPAVDNLASLGDYWLTSAIAQDLIEPLDLPAETLAKLPVAWQQFVKRNAERDPGDDSQPTSVWAAPYKVQTLVIVYRQSQFPQANPPFKAWSDLLQPQLRRQLALPDHPRIVIGLLQKMQTGSFNPSFEGTADSAVALPLSDSLAESFAQLNQQVRTYDSSTSLKALVNEDITAAVAWSGDVIAALKRYRDLKAVVPAEGSLLSADMWVRPKGAEMSAAAKKWIAFCLQTGPATQISSAGKGLSPIFLSEDASLPDALENSDLSIAAIQKSEPLLPLPAAMQTAYLDLWQQLRAG